VGFLAIAASEPDADAAKAALTVAKYLIGWRRPGDFGFIAVQNGEIIGAAWARSFPSKSSGSATGTKRLRRCRSA